SGSGYNGDLAGNQRASNFFYVCYDTNTTRDETKLLGQDMIRALEGIACHKLLILDVCHAGSVAELVRPVARDGLPLLIFSACATLQEAVEPAGGKNGLFTQALLEAVGELPAVGGGVRGKDVRLPDLARYVRQRMRSLLEAEPGLKGLPDPGK